MMRSFVLGRCNRLLCGAIVACSLLVTTRSFAVDIAWPQTTNETKPWSRWWWLGSIVTEDGLRSEMKKYADAGLGGLEITPIYGVRGEEDQFIQYLSPKWVDRFEFVLGEARRLGIGIDMATGTGWPFGGPWVTPEDTCKYLASKTFTVKAGEKLTEPVVMIERFMAAPRKHHAIATERAVRRHPEFAAIGDRQFENAESAQIEFADGLLR